MMQLSFPGMGMEPPKRLSVHLDVKDGATVQARVWNAGHCFNAAYGWYLGWGDTPELAVKNLINRIEKELKYRG